MKVTVYMTLIDQFTHIIDIIFKIVNDIIPFMIVMFTIVLFSALCFYVIGQNQIDFDFKNHDAGNGMIPYQSITGAMWYVINMCFGEFDTSYYELG